MRGLFKTIFFPLRNAAGERLSWKAKQDGNAPPFHNLGESAPTEA
jgi:hypothetical protein